MHTSTAVVRTDAPVRYAKQLASHLGRKVAVEEVDGAHRLTFAYGVGIVRAEDGQLVLEATAADADSLAKVEDVLARHLVRFGRRNELAVSWDVEISPGETREPQVITGLDGLRARLGETVGVSDWVTVEQDKVTEFAKLTGDEQWIHVDPERAKNGPFGVTVQHGFLTLGMATGLLWSIFTVEGFAVILNYGLNKVRFPAPLKVGARMRMHTQIAEVEELKGGAQAVYHLTYEVAGEAKPCCVADLVFRYYD